MSDSDSSQKIPKSFLYTMIPLNLVVGVAVIILNSLVGHFYRKGKRNTAALLYIYLTGWDVTMGVTAVLHAIYMIITVTTDMEAAEETMKVLISGVYVVTNVAVRSSVFANTVLSVVRTINISQPFYRVRKRNLHIVYWTCFIFLITLCAVDIYFTLSRENQKENPLGAFPEFRNDFLLNPALGASIMEDVIKGNRKNKLLRDTLVSNGYFHLATVTAVICLAIQSRVLLWNPDAKSMRKDAASSAVETQDTATHQSEEPGAKPKESGKQSSELRTTITIIQLTTVFCLCNTAYTVFVIWLLEKNEGIGDGEDITITMSNRLSFYITSTFVPFLNSLINPLILIVRSSGVRQFVKSKLEL